MLDTDYQHYAILRMSLLWRGKDFHVLKYFSKLRREGGSALCRPGLPSSFCTCSSESGG